jgi:hypothetical protein
VICYVIRVGIGGDHFISVINTDPEDETIRFGGLVNGDACQKLPANFQARCAIDGTVLDVGQRERQFAYGVKVDHDGFNHEVKAAVDTDYADEASSDGSIRVIRVIRGSSCSETGAT